MEQATECAMHRAMECATERALTMGSAMGRAMERAMERSMERAMEETRRRREKQSAYNLEHGITPTTIIREVSDILGELGDKPSASRSRRVRERGVAEPKTLPLAGASGHNLKAVIASVEKKLSCRLLPTNESTKTEST